MKTTEKKKKKKNNGKSREKSKINNCKRWEKKGRIAAKPKKRGDEDIR